MGLTTKKAGGRVSKVPDHAAVLCLPSSRVFSVKKRLVTHGHSTPWWLYSLAAAIKSTAHAIRSRALTLVPITTQVILQRVCTTSVRRLWTVSLVARLCGGASVRRLKYYVAGTDREASDQPVSLGTARFALRPLTKCQGITSLPSLPQYH
jgi:hypothetical protein